ncbi:hypothetical protein, partial [Brevibacillus reuszeri]|uniref:hypothetical protein n=1 Tax=Brevibacillus reuszeri TaxID=54915 RepID=UPI003D1F9AD7
AINLTTLEVKFTQPVTEIATSNITLSKGTIDTVALSDDKKTVKVAVQGLNYKDDVQVKVSGVKAGDKTVPDYTTNVKIPAVTDLYMLDITTDDDDNVILADGATKVMLTATLKDKKTGAIANVDGVVKFTATKGGLAQDEVTLEDGKASVQLTSAASDSSIVSYIHVTVVDAPAAKEYEGLTGSFEVIFSPDPTNPGEVTFVNMVSAESNQADRFFVKFSNKISAAKFKEAITVNGVIDPSFGLEINGGPAAIKDVIQKADNVLEFILDTDSPGSIVPNSWKINRQNPSNGVAPNYLQDNETHKLTIPANIGHLVLQNTTGIDFIVTDAKRPFIYGVTPKDQLEFKVRFSESMAEDLVEGNHDQINTKFLLDGKKVRLFKTSAPTVAQINSAKANNEVIVTDLYVGSYNAVTGEDTRSEVYFKLHPEFKLSSGKHQIQIANVGDWAALVDPNNKVSTQTFDFTVTVNDTKPVPAVTVQSPEQWLLTFNTSVSSVTGKKVEDAFKIYKADDSTIPFVYGTDYVIIPVDENGLAVGAEIAAGSAVPHADRYLVEFKNDWTEYYKTASTTVNYFTSSKNPYKIVVNHLRSDLHNVMDEKALDVTLTYDGKSPTITSAVDVFTLETKSANRLAAVTGEGQQVFVKMSEPVQMYINGLNDDKESAPLTPSEQQKAGTGIPVPTYEFVQGDKVVNGTVVRNSIAADDQSFVIEPATTLESGTWTLYIRSISDDVGNTSATVSTTVTIPGSPVLVSDTKVAWVGFDNDATNKDYLYIKFTKEMDPSGAAGVSRTTNYVFNGVQLPQGSQVVRGIRNADGTKVVTNDWDGVTIEMPKGAFDGANGERIDFRSVLNVANNFKAADGEKLSGPYEVQLDDTTNNSAADNDMLFEAAYHNSKASATLNGAAVLNAEVTDANANGKIDTVVLTLDQAATFTATDKIKVGGKTFVYSAGSGTTSVTFVNDGASNEITGTASDSLRVTALNGGIIINTGVVADNAKPVVISTKGTAGSKDLTLTFSEPVYGSGADEELVVSDFVYQEGNAGVANGPLVSVASNGGYVTSLVVTATTALTNNDLGTNGDKVVFAATVKDLNGNFAAAPSIPVGDTTAPVIDPVAGANVSVADAATWTAPTAVANDNVDGNISANVVVAYTSTDAGSNVTDLASARAHLATAGNTVKVTYTVSDAAGNAATPVTATFTAL